MTIYDQTLGMAVLLLVGYLGGRMAKLVKMPMVAGYVIIGLVLGPSVLNIIPEQLSMEFDIVKVLGLGIIALMIGGELEIKRIKHLGKSILGITLAQLLATFFIVFIATFYILGLSSPISLLLAAMATATAPAATVAVIREYKAKGPFTTSLLSIVALDDAGCIIIFGVAAAIARMVLDGTFAFGTHMIIEPAIELFGSLAIGTIAGLILVILLRYVADRQHKIVIMVGLALLNSGLSMHFHLSPLLTNMMAGFVFTNLSSRPHNISVLNDIEFPIFVVFFTLAGVSLHLDILLANWAVAVVYIIARAIGKIGGVYLGARASGAPLTVQKYLGIAMLPKAGVTIGLVMLVQGRFPEIAVIITAIELAAVSVNELIGPLAAKHALVSAGEIELTRIPNPSQSHSI